MVRMEHGPTGGPAGFRGSAAWAAVVLVHRLSAAAPDQSNRTDRWLLKPAAFADNEPSDRESALVRIDEAERLRVSRHVEPAGGENGLARPQPCVERHGCRVSHGVVSPPTRVGQVHDGALLAHRHAPGAIRQPQHHLIRGIGSSHRSMSLHDCDAPVVEALRVAHAIDAPWTDDGDGDDHREVDGRGDAEPSQDAAGTRPPSPRGERRRGEQGDDGHEGEKQKQRLEETHQRHGAGYITGVRKSHSG